MIVVTTFAVTTKDSCMIGYSRFNKLTMTVSAGLYASFIGLPEL